MQSILDSEGDIFGLLGIPQSHALKPTRLYSPFHQSMVQLFFEKNSDHSQK